MEGPGSPISDIARVLQKPPGSIHGMLEATGGFSPTHRAAQTTRCTCPGRAGGDLPWARYPGESLRAIVRAIARRLGRPASTVCREVNRNGGRRNYRATKADERAWEKARRPKRCLLAMNEPLRDMVARKLREDWSPQQISGWLKREYPDDEVMHISHETIYCTLFVASQRRSQKGTTRSPAIQADGCARGTTLPRQDSRADSSKKPSPSVSVLRGGGGQSGARPGARPLGRRPALGIAQHPHSHPARTQLEVRKMLVRVGGKDTETVVVAALSEQL